MLFAAGVVQLAVMLVQPVLPLYIAELQGSMDNIVMVSGIVFSVVGISGIFAAPMWGHRVSLDALRRAFGRRSFWRHPGDSRRHYAFCDLAFCGRHLHGGYFPGHQFTFG